MPEDDFNGLIVDCQRRMMAGDHTAITELHKHLSGGLIVHFLRRLGGSRRADGSVAEDLAQRTWIEFWKALQGGTYDPTRSRPSTFLYAIAANIWLRHRREQHRRNPQALGDLDQLLTDPASTHLEDNSQLAQSLELIRRVVNGDEPHAPFSSSDRQMMKWIADDHSERDIAGFLAIAPSTMHERKGNLLAKLGSFLGGRRVISRNSRATPPHKGEEQEAT